MKNLRKNIVFGAASANHCDTSHAEMGHAEHHDNITWANREEDEPDNAWERGFPWEHCRDTDKLPDTIVRTKSSRRIVRKTYGDFIIV